LRKEEHAQEKVFYMLQNPVRAGLARNSLDYPLIWRRVSTTTVVGALS
jgi:hypothetical protein